LRRGAPPLSRSREIALAKRGLSELSERERRIFRTRELDDDPPTLEELGRELGISRERVRLIDFATVPKIRAAIWRHLAQVEKDRSWRDRKPSNDVSDGFDRYRLYRTLIDKTLSPETALALVQQRAASRTKCFRVGPSIENFITECCDRYGLNYRNKLQ
jgi:Zn-dependent peptidase ImmA (M78 family)